MFNILQGRQVLKRISNHCSKNRTILWTQKSALALLGLALPYISVASSDLSYDKLNALVQQAQIKQGIQPAGNLAPPTTNTDAKDSNDNSDDTPAKKGPTLRDEAFKQLLDKITPLTPEQIIEMHRHKDKTEQAIATPVNTPPRPVSSTLTIDLSPGVTPPVIRLSSGFVSSLVFVDSTGQPWPISDYSMGNPKSFNVQWDKKTNTLFIQSATTYATANLAVRLLTLDTPVMLSLVSGQKEVDYRVDLQIQGRGPNAEAPLVGDGLPSTSPNLLNALDGVPPTGSQELKVSGGPGRAWLSDGKLIFRTQLTVLSPAWSATVSSPDGTRVYEMSPTPLILASQNGKPIKIELSGF